MYAYNADGSLDHTTDAKGQVRKYSYDSLGRAIQADSTPSGAFQPDACQEVQYYYDLPTVAEWATTTNGWGRVTGIYWSGGPSCQYQFAEKYAYTAAGQIF